MKMFVGLYFYSSELKKEAVISFLFFKGVEQVSVSFGFDFSVLVLKWRRVQVRIKLRHKYSIRSNVSSIICEAFIKY